MLSQGVSQQDELAHDGGDGDLCGFSGFSELIVFCFQVRVEACGDEGRHVKSARRTLTHPAELRQARASR